MWPWKPRPYSNSRPPEHLIDEEIDVDITRCETGDPGWEFEDCDGLYDDFKGPALAKEFPISEVLANQFRTWRLDVTDQERQGQEDFSDLDQRGLELARLMQQELPYRKVIYYDSHRNKFVIRNEKAGGSRG